MEPFSISPNLCSSISIWGSDRPGCGNKCDFQLLCWEGWNDVVTATPIPSLGHWLKSPMKQACVEMPDCELLQLRHTAKQL